MPSLGITGGALLMARELESHSVLYKVQNLFTRQNLKRMQFTCTGKSNPDIQHRASHLYARGRAMYGAIQNHDAGFQITSAYSKAVEALREVGELVVDALVAYDPYEGENGFIERNSLHRLQEHRCHCTSSIIPVLHDAIRGQLVAAAVAHSPVHHKAAILCFSIRQTNAARAS
jgi:hypothetical protein